jgi:uncharacterized membrane protein
MFRTFAAGVCLHLAYLAERFTHKYFSHIRMQCIHVSVSVHILASSKLAHLHTHICLHLAACAAIYLYLLTRPDPS